MEAKLRIRMGSIEVEYEGSEEFLKKELPDLLQTVLELHGRSLEDADLEEQTDDSGGKSHNPNRTKVSASTAAATLGSKTGSDLALAAAASLVIGEGKESFSRAELLKAMQSAKAHYKGTFRNNLSNYISTLVTNQSRR